MSSIPVIPMVGDQQATVSTFTNRVYEVNEDGNVGERLDHILDEQAKKTESLSMLNGADSEHSLKSILDELAFLQGGYFGNSGNVIDLPEIHYGSGCYIPNQWKSGFVLWSSDQNNRLIWARKYRQGEWTGDWTPLATTTQLHNPNLLDNSDFRKKDFVVNQRNNESYIANGYCFDRWILWNANTACNIQDGYIELFSTDGATGGTLVQKLPYQLPAGTYTISIDAIGSFQSNYTIEGIGTIGNAFIENAERKIASTTFTIPESQTQTGQRWIALDNRNLDSTNKLKVYRIKLETGSVSTLANDPPPNPQQELAKCQRYYRNVLFNAYCYAVNEGGAWLQVAQQYDMRTNILSSNMKITHINLPMIGNTTIGTLNTAWGNSAGEIIEFSLVGSGCEYGKWYEVWATLDCNL